MSTTEDQAFNHIIGCFPELENLITTVGPLILPPSKHACVAAAVTQIVIGQMLSRHAARTIYERIEKLRLDKDLDGSWKLKIDELTELGVSGRKARTITEFGKEYDSSPNTFEAWCQLEHGDVVNKVSKYWGLSTWSADMLSIFHFGFIDVFPEKDGTIQKAVNVINKKYYDNSSFEPNKASPYKTYLSLYLWKMIDQNIL